MSHGEAWLIAGKAAILFIVAMLPIMLFTSNGPGAVPGGVAVYILVLALFYCAGAGYI